MTFHKDICGQAEKCEEAEMCHRESDRLIVVTKQGNACGAKGPASNRKDPGPHSPNPESEKRGMGTKLDLITRRAREDKACKFNNLMHLVNAEGLRECFVMLKKDKAAGVDGKSVEEYGAKLEEQLEDLVMRLKQMNYRPQPVRRVYIPKGNGKKRALGIPTVEDKLVQMALTRILEAIWEEDFLDFSYGYRKGRSCHQALAHIDRALMKRPTQYVIEADIKGFFDNVSHEWLERALERRITDQRFIRYILRFLKSGIMEEGKHLETEKGTPQGGIISPVLANIYLHYVLDRWFVRWMNKEKRGYAEMIRYADDFLICVEREETARQLLNELRERLAEYGLELAEDKTRILRFGKRQAQGKNDDDDPPTGLSFLGFTHYWGHSRSGWVRLKRRTDKKRYAKALRKVSDWLKLWRNQLPMAEIWKTVSLMMVGHYRYFGVSDNTRSLNCYYQEVVERVYKWLNRRSQRRSFNWESFAAYMDRFPLPRPRIYYDLYHFGI